MNDEGKTPKSIEELNKIADKAVDAMFSVHRRTGPGFHESIYQACLEEELTHRGIKFQPQLRIPVTYRGKVLKKHFRLDILVEDEIIIELKSVADILPVHEAQLLSYMKLAGKRLGYVANFHVPLMKEGITRKRLDDATEWEKKLRD